METFNLDANRSDLVQFPFFNVKNLLTILQKPSIKYHQNIQQIVQIFPTSIWVLTIMSLLTLSTFNILLNSRKNWSKTLLDYIKIILAQSLIHTQYQKRTLLSTWIISSFLLTFHFKNDILSSIMTVHTTTITEFNKLFNKKCKIFVEHGKYLALHMKNVLVHHICLLYKL